MHATTSNLSYCDFQTNLPFKILFAVVRSISQFLSYFNCTVSFLLYSFLFWVLRLTFERNYTTARTFHWPNSPLHIMLHCNEVSGVHKTLKELNRVNKD